MLTLGSGKALLLMFVLTIGFVFCDQIKDFVFPLFSSIGEGLNLYP